MIDLDLVAREYRLDPDHLTVNHGSFGATPQSVLAVQREWRDRMEAQPTRFMVRELPAALRAAAGVLADFVGAQADDTVFVENATVGANAVLRSLAFEPGDEIVVLDHGYGAVLNTVRHVCERTGARMVEAAVPFPRPADDAVVEAVRAAISPRTRLAVLDHITSASALVLPIARMVAACHDCGVPVLVDGAHAPGQVAFDLSALGADWYVGNCHKWLMAPKGAGFLHAPVDRQAGLHPVTISHGYGRGFLAEFDWTGTRDMTAFLAVPAGIAAHRELGGPILMARNVALAAAAAAQLADRFHTETGTGAGQPCAMSLVRLPLTDPVDPSRALRVRENLLDWRTDVPVSALTGAAWIRLSAQAYNTINDFERLGDLLHEKLAIP